MFTVLVSQSVRNRLLVLALAAALVLYGAALVAEGFGKKLRLPFTGGGGAARKPGAAHAQQPDIATLETELSESLGTKVAIAHGKGGKGKLVIHYTDLDTLDGVLERLRPRQG